MQVCESVVDLWRFVVRAGQTIYTGAMTDAACMQRALRLARRAAGQVEPNPMVGCVIVRSGKIVGEGYHRKFGGPHAEVHALQAAGAQARGATIYVTLEPCTHHGKTPPCADAVIAARPKRVVVGCRDPFEKVAGRGIRKMRRAGITVDVGVCGDEADRLIAPFAKRVTTGLPYVIAKWAATVDGAIATRTGDSQWISCPESRRVVHQLRARVDAVVVGIGTALADDPMLDAREVKVRRIARRVVIDPKLRLPIDWRLVQTADRLPLTLATTPEAMTRRAGKTRTLEMAGVEVIAIPGMALDTLLRYLADQHAATNVLVEGGGKTHGSFFEAGLVDELLVFLGPHVVGDARAIRPVAGQGPVAQIADAAPLALQQVRRIGEDVMLRYGVQRSRKA